MEKREIYSHLKKFRENRIFYSLIPNALISRNFCRKKKLFINFYSFQPSTSSHHAVSQQPQMIGKPCCKCSSNNFTKKLFNFNFFFSQQFLLNSLKLSLQPLRQWPLCRKYIQYSSLRLINLQPRNLNTLGPLNSSINNRQVKSSLLH